MGEEKCHYTDFQREKNKRLHFEVLQIKIKNVSRWSKIVP
jgi:hypothetical protein